MMKKTLYIAGMALLAVPAALYMKQLWQQDMVALINQETEQQPSAAGAAPEKFRAGRILVQPKAGLSDEEFQKILSKNQGKALEKIGNLRVHVISVPEKAEEAVVKALSKNPNVEFAEVDAVAEPDVTAVNDPQFANAWHLPKMRVPDAWDYGKGDGIVIAILDTGVDGTHPDLASQMIPGWNAVDGSSATNDIYGHGTSVAGTAAAATNNAVGISSIAWGAKIMPIRVSNNSTSGTAYTSDIARGLSWAADNGADVANISYAMTGSATVSSAAQYMRNKGGLVVVSAGNSGNDPGIADSPYMITVSATDANDVKASWSCYGAFVDVAAPGVSILSTKNGGSYGNVSGTSFSAPATAGVVAAMFSVNPKLTPADVEAILEKSADKVAGVDFHPYYGFGRVNALNALQMAASTVVRDTQAPTVSIFSPTQNASVNGVIQVDVSASDDVGVNEVSLFANGQLVGTDGVAPYQFSWDSASVGDGSVVLTATATDAAGNQGASAAVSVGVANQTLKVVDASAPVARISAPVSGSVVTGTATINASATDNVAVTSLQLYIDGKLILTTQTGALSYRWNTKKEVKTTHPLKVVAKDAAGNTGEFNSQVVVK